MRQKNLTNFNIQGTAEKPDDFQYTGLEKPDDF